MVSNSSPKGFVARNTLFVIVSALLVFTALSVAGYFYLQYQKTQEQLANPTASTEQEVKKLVDEIGKMIVLPTNETPEVATVSDVEKLKGQSFFARAKNGDKVLIYTKSQKAVLYDPTVKKIVEVGPINLSQTTPTVSPQAPKNITVALYNGSSTVGLTTKVETQLKQSMPIVRVVQKANASKATYQKTLVVDVSGKNAEGAKQLATILGGEVGKMPSGESAPQNVLGATTSASSSGEKVGTDVDILVILAQNAN